MAAFLKNLDLVPLDLVMVAVGIALFVSFWRAMQAVFFAPYLRLLVARESETVGTEESAAATREQAELLVADYERQMTEVRVAALKQKFSVTEGAKSRAAKIIEKAEMDAQEHARTVRAAIERELEELNQQADRELAGLVDLLTERVKTLAAGGHGK